MKGNVIYMTRILPSDKRSRLRSYNQVHQRDPVSPRVKPEIFVKVSETRSWVCGKYAEARIRTRSGGYRYLIWWEEGKQREFYLGKVKESTLDGAAVQLARAGSSRKRPRRSGKGKNFGL